MASTNEADSSERVPTRSSLRTWIRLHPISAFFILAYVGTWLLELPMVLGKDGLGLLPFNVPLPLYIVLFLLSSFSGPTLAAFLVTHALEGKAGMKRLFRRYGKWRVGLLWYLVVIFGFPLVYLASASIALGGIPFASIRANALTFFTSYLPALLIFPAFITWGEEPGWRGFALTRLQERYSPLLSSLVVGLFHGIWHLPIFLIVVGPPAQGPFNFTQFATNVGVIMVITILWTWVFNHARGSILIAVLLHASLNAAQAWIGALIPNFPPAASQIATYFYIAAALVLILVTRGRLGYQPQAAAQPVEASPVTE